MAKLTFWGATGTTTGSKFILDTGENKILIDCGVFQGKKELRLKNWEKFPVPPKTISKVLLSHAHIDHSGYLPKFCREGFNGMIHSTHSTFDLCKLLLKDSGYIHEEDAKWANKRGYSKHKPAKPLYTVADAEKSLEYFFPVQYGADLFIENDLRVKFKDAGHILGSGFVDIKRTKGKQSRKIVFSGDMGRPSKAFLRDPVQIFNVDYLVLESTYGNRLHDNSNPVEDLARVINDSVKRGGVLLVPAFSVGRTQHLLYNIRELEASGKIPKLPVYIDSPMAINATNVFTKRTTDQNIESRVSKINGIEIFQTNNLNICIDRNQSKAINEIKSKAIIISASGMVTGGRILHHMANRLPNKKNTILFIGYQAQGTRGRSISEGNETVKIHGQQVPINAQIESISGFSGHADYNEILAWLMGFNKAPKKVFIVHGEPESRIGMADKIRERFKWNVEIPEYGQSFEIDL